MKLIRRKHFYLFLFLGAALSPGDVHCVGMSVGHKCWHGIGYRVAGVDLGAGQGGVDINGVGGAANTSLRSINTTQKLKGFCL
jgi:hypothetical protein